MSYYTFVFPVTRFVAKKNQLWLGEYYSPTNDEVLTMGRVHLDHGFLSGLPRTIITTEGDYKHTFNREEEFTNIKMSWKLQLSQQFVDTLSKEVAKQVSLSNPAVDDNGVSYSTGMQLHVKVNSHAKEVKTLNGAWTSFNIEAGDVLGYSIVLSGNEDYVTYGEVMSLEDSLDILFKTTKKNTVLDKEEARASLLKGAEKVSQRSRKQRTASADMKIESVQEGSAAASLADKIKSMQSNGLIPTPASQALSIMKGGDL
jgi:hypothetical protein